MVPLRQKFSIEKSPISYIYRTGLAVKADAQRLLKEQGFDITITQYVILTVLQEEDGLSQKEIGDVLIKDKPNISRILDVLERKKLIFRQPTNRRQYAVFLTDEGKKLVGEILPLIEQLNEQATRGLLAREIETLKSLLDKVYENIS
jgi:DNA-binding MarR family transcriptional regulator